MIDTWLVYDMWVQAFFLFMALQIRSVTVSDPSNITLSNNVFNGTAEIEDQHLEPCTNETLECQNYIGNNTNLTSTIDHEKCGEAERFDKLTDQCVPVDTIPETVKTIMRVTEMIGRVTVPLFLLISLTGNCLTLIVMFSDRFWNLSCSVILIALALSDSTYSIVFPFSKLFVRDMIGYDARALSEIGCHIFFIVHKASKMLSSWFIVAICVERLVAVWFPLKAKFICTKRNTFIGVLLITTGMFIFTGVWTFSTKIINGICVPNYATPSTAALARGFIIAGSTVFSLIPATLLIILTPAICYKIAMHSKKRQELSQKNSAPSDTSRANAMLLGVSIAYIILVTPTGIAHMVCFNLNINFYEDTSLSMVITRAILQVTEQLNYSINFLLYVMCNKSFRDRVVQVLCFRKRITRHNTYTSRMTSTTKATVSKF